MARGWESKSVEAQIELAQTRTNGAAAAMAPDPAQLQRIRQRESLELSRRRVLRDLESAQNPRYREVLNKALADLTAQLETIS